MNRTSSASESEFSSTEKQGHNNLLQLIKSTDEIPYAKPTGSSRNWRAYNCSQDDEKRLFRIMLRELCNMVEEKDQSRGRPRIPTGDMIFSAAYMVYSNHPARRFKTDLLELGKNGFISKVPHRNSISNYLLTESFTTIVTNLIEISSLPLKDFETHFPVDSTGLSTDRYARWVDDRTKEDKARRKWVKLHLICGAKTNIVTSVIVTPGEASDSRQFGRLVDVTKRNFNIKEISADAGYLSGENMRHAILAGAIPFINFKSNNVLDADYKSTPWKSLLRLYSERHWVYMSYYNMRNNVETTFSMIKGKFDGRLWSVNERSQINEALLKVLCHNICVLIRSAYELSIDITFPTDTSVLIESEHKESSKISIAGGRITGVIGGKSFSQGTFSFTNKNRKASRKIQPENQLPLFG